MKATSKLFQANAIINSSADKAEAIARIQKELAVTKSNAFVYYTKCTKAVSEKTGEKAVKNTSKSDKTAQVIVEKASETAKKQRQTAQGQSASTKAKKVKDIDEMIANLAAQGQATPFGSLVK